MESSTEAASCFLQQGYHDLTNIVFAMQRSDGAAIADAAERLAARSYRIGAESLADAARELVVLAHHGRSALQHALTTVARDFAEVESEIRTAMEREVPLFI